MATSSISSATANLQGAGLGLQDLLKILLTQLQYQDPLKPMDNQEFVAQIAQFSALEANQQLNNKVDQLLSIQSTTQTIGMIGKTVDVSNGNGGVVSGVVSALSFTNGDPQITIKQSDGTLVPGITLGQISAVR
ncbi:flagellar basal-body rod modification protein FlgD [Andreprevotia lacus DSM 23236]|jgi:flagellar basal-body rod modification protein FlgD|uniref:Basal-body rod modification protein FlgD n=1 Tax=Andreprevotia lacus DSM 23236 TaxID=1121001 RepID=A0A1W1XV03_9NEIS|nr:flagellar hook capping FlgD N-terminal domain-containing protein [Andreprevotia lacus]SMC27674.1 flagellar basal-body rod modification protein FlgD [Andreprevotia lacus DSM 23236]